MFDYCNIDLCARERCFVGKNSFSSFVRLMLVRTLKSWKLQIDGDNCLIFYGDYSYTLWVCVGPIYTVFNHDYEYF